MFFWSFLTFSINKYFFWQFDLWFLCFFYNELEHKEFHSSCTVEKDKIVAQHPLLNGHEFEQTLGELKNKGVQCAVVHGVQKHQIKLSI